MKNYTIFPRVTGQLAVHQLRDLHQRGKLLVPSKWPHIIKEVRFVDSVLMNQPTKPLFIRRDLTVESGDCVYDVIDGSARMSALMSYIDGNFHEFDGMTMAALDKEGVQRFWAYSFNVEYLSGTHDEAAATWDAIETRWRNW
jgi:hypothetical protein